MFRVNTYKVRKLFLGDIIETVFEGIRVEGDDIRLQKVLPTMPADLFGGQDLVVLARYTGHGPARVVVEGRSHGHDVRWTSNARFPSDSRENAFVPRLWAAQRIGFLAAGRRYADNSQEVIDEIRSLGERYGIPTEFTSYLVQEPRSVAADAPPGVRVRSPDGASAGVGGAMAPNEVRRFESAKLASAQRNVKSVAVLDSLGTADSRRDGSGVQAGGHVFRLQDGRWVDTKLTVSTRVVQVQAYSASYFAILGQIPELRALFAVGDHKSPPAFRRRCRY